MRWGGKDLVRTEWCGRVFLCGWVGGRDDRLRGGDGWGWEGWVGRDGGVGW